MSVVDSAVSKRTVRFELTPRRAIVRDVSMITPSYLRISFTGDDLAGFQSLDPDDHIKVAFPAPGVDEVALPVKTHNGIEWPPDAPRILRDYTPRSFDADTNELVIDFVIHGHGPASEWASQAAPGQSVGILGPRGSRLIDGQLDWQLLIGDETALPTIARRLEEAPPGESFAVFIEIDGSTEEQPIATKANADIHWAHRNGAAPGTSRALEDALREFSFPEGVFYTRAHGEASTLKSIRRYLVRERGVVPEYASFSGHWKLGVANHDHHEPIED